MSMNPLLYDVKYDSDSGIMTFLDKAGNEIYSCEPVVDDPRKPLTFKALEDNSTIAYCYTGGGYLLRMQYSMDEGKTWKSYTPSREMTLKKGERISFRLERDGSEGYTDERYYFTMKGRFAAYHNISSVNWLTGDIEDFSTVGNNTLSRRAHGMFKGCTSLVKAPLILAARFEDYAAHEMFSGCTNLVKAPKLYATRFDKHAVDSMFSGCTSLTEAPELPATTLATGCYQSMFSGCTGLTKAPVLPATTLVAYCYYSMFSGCTGLTKAPELPATTLVAYCYHSMFSGCTGLTKAPELPATTLATDCYHSMFSGCTSLTKAPELPATVPRDYCYYGMFSGCTSLVEAPKTMPNGAYQGCFDSMFKGCTSLTKAPSLPYTGGLYPRCYRSMFEGCTSLTEAPELPSTYLSQNCYASMFKGCTSLMKAPNLPATTTSSGCYTSMFQGCTSLESASSLKGPDSTDFTSWLADVPPTGSLYTDPLSIASYPRSGDGVPEGWDIWVYDAESTGETVQFLHEGNLVDIFVGNSAYGICFSREGWKGFKTYTQMRELGYVSSETSQLYHALDGVLTQETVESVTSPSLGRWFYVGGDLLTTHEITSPTTGLVSIHYLGYTIAEPSPLRLYRFEEPCDAYVLLPSDADETTQDFYNVPGSSRFDYTWNELDSLGYTQESRNFTGLTLYNPTPEDGTVCLQQVGAGGNNHVMRLTGGLWAPMEMGKTYTVPPGSSMQIFRPSKYKIMQTQSSYRQFVLSGTFEASGNLNSMLNSHFEDLTDLSGYSYAFCKMFQGCTSLTEAPELPATTLANYCYQYMFQGCTSLTEAPELPATTLANYCYQYMFSGCTGLTEAPELPATTLVDSDLCYSSMFSGCTGLTKAPELPATRLAGQCYYSMFYGCTSLTEAPELPATTLTGQCYSRMFYGCTSLVKAPKLPATRLESFCYQRMFYGCSSLQEVYCAAKNYLSGNASFWLDGVSSTGTFYADPDANWSSGVDGIPENWTRAPLSDYPAA